MDSPEATPVTLAELHFRMAKIRFFEEELLSSYQKGNLAGTTHTYIGQEATAVAALSHLEDDDTVCSQHRSHGYFIAGGGDPRRLFLEILGDVDGVCNGVGGSQHLYSQRFLSNGILGGTSGLAVGLALAAKLHGRGMAVSFLGDGTLGEGIVYESFNLAALWKLPVLFVIENNRYAQTTPVEAAVAGTIVGRAQAFGIASDEIESNDVAALRDRFGAAFSHVRHGEGPFCQVVHTYRLGPHSKGDDHRPAEELAHWRARDPLSLSARALGPQAAEIEKRARAEVETAMSLPPSVRALSLDAFGGDDNLIPDDHAPTDGWRLAGGRKWLVNHMQSVFRDLLTARPDLYLLGEDIKDPYGGAFKMYKGLSSAFPDRVLGTPVSEAGIVAAANGLALRGFRPVVEIMFGDFLPLALDQLINHAAKIKQMYRLEGGCPTILRVPSGGYRGYGPTHSQSLEKLVLGVPGLVVTVADPIHDPRLLWERMLGLSSPCVHVENKTLYAEELPNIVDGSLGPFRLESDRGYFPVTRLTLAPTGSKADAAIVTYGGLVSMAIDSAKTLFREDELLVDVVVTSQLAPLPLASLVGHLSHANAVVVLEEGSERAGFGAEAIAALTCAGALGNRRAARCAACDTVIPANANLERQVLPSVERLVQIARKVCRQ